MKMVMSRKELMVALSISRTHLIRTLKTKGIEPIENTLHASKKLYLVSEIEKAFNIVINEEGQLDHKGKDEKDFMTDIGDILKED